MTDEQLELQKIWNLIDETIKCGKRNVERKLHILSHLVTKAEAINPKESEAMDLWIEAKWSEIARSNDERR